MIRRSFPLARTLAVVAAAGLAAACQAGLPVGAVAPDFTTQVSLAGKPMPFNLKTALKKGPVVLYFFPAAFTSGCTVEAHEFAEATEDFKKMGATVIGMTAGNVDRIAEFSSVECRDKFAVGAAAPDTIKSYDVAMAMKPGWTDRTSYVIAPDGKIAFAYSAMKPEGHVSGTMDAVKAWRAAHPAKGRAAA